MDYRYLKAFISTAQHKSFSKAADELAIAQSAVSRQISLLEESVGQQLFLRSSRSVVLTPAGQELLAEAQRFESWIQQRFTEEIVHIRIAALPGIVENWLSGKLIELAKNGELPNLSIFHATNDEIETGLLKGEYDLGFVTSKIETGVLTSRKLFDEKFSLISKKSVSISDLPDEVWIYGIQGENLRKLSKTVSPRFIRVESHSALLKMVEAGLGVAVVPEHIVPPSSKVIRKDLSQHKGGSVYICQPNVKMLSATVKNFVQAIT